MKTIISVAAALLLAPFTIACAHHSVLNYDGKVEVTVSGTVTSARFSFPHSIYRIDVEKDDGSVEKWVLSTEDPRDAERLGFADELKAIKVGDPITVVGWPDKYKKNTIRGHELHYPDGTVVMMRRGNYIWPKGHAGNGQNGLESSKHPGRISVDRYIAVRGRPGHLLDRRGRPFDPHGT